MANYCHRLTHASDTDQNLLHEVVGLVWHNFYTGCRVSEPMYYNEKTDKLETESTLFKIEQKIQCITFNDKSLLIHTHT